MNRSDIQVLYAYNRWANDRILEAAARVPPNLLMQDLQSSHSSVMGTLAHMFWSEWLWLGRWQEAPPPGSSPLDCPGLPALRSRWHEIDEARRRFLEALTESDLDRPISYENPPGTPWTYSLVQMLQHIVNHSAYHRGQVSAMLRQLGAAAVPTDFLVFVDETSMATDRRADGGA